MRLDNNVICDHRVEKPLDTCELFFSSILLRTCIDRKKKLLLKNVVNVMRKNNKLGYVFLFYFLVVYHGSR